MDLQRLKPHFPWITLLVLVVVVGHHDPSFLKPGNLLRWRGTSCRCSSWPWG